MLSFQATTALSFSENCLWAAWEPWTICDKSCGEGRQIRTRTVAANEKNGGSICNFVRCITNRNDENCQFRQQRCNTFVECPGKSNLVKGSLH